MLDPIWLGLGIPMEETTNAIQHISSYHHPMWITVTMGVVLAFGMIYKSYRIIKNDNREDQQYLQDRYLVIPYEKVLKVDFK